MTRPVSDASLADVIDQLFMDQDGYESAVRNSDVPKANRLLLRVSGGLDSLASRGADGRLALERLLEQASPYMRLRAAGSVLSWAPEKAIPVLARLVDDELGVARTPEERLDIRTEAKGWLYRHFGIRNGDRNALIEPLKAYGVALAYRDPAKWQ